HSAAAPIPPSPTAVSTSAAAPGSSASTSPTPLLDRTAALQSRSSQLLRHALYRFSRLARDLDLSLRRASVLASRYQRNLLAPYRIPIGRKLARRSIDHSSFN